MICVDNTLLTLLYHPAARPPDDPTTGKPIERLQDRLNLLVETWKENAEEIIIPANVLSEFLILAKDDGPAFHARIVKASNFSVMPFDEMAAVELAAMQLAERAGEGKGGKKKWDAIPTYAKLKFDKQIVAIAKANGAAALYSDDGNVKTFAERHGVKVIQTHELATPAAVQELLFPPESPADLRLTALGDGSGEMNPEKTKATPKGGSSEGGS